MLRTIIRVAGGGSLSTGFTHQVSLSSHCIHAFWMQADAGPRVLRNISKPGGSFSYQALLGSQTDMDDNAAASPCYITQPLQLLGLNRFYQTPRGLPPKLLAPFHYSVCDPINTINQNREVRGRTAGGSAARCVAACLLGAGFLLFLADIACGFWCYCK